MLCMWWLKPRECTISLRDIQHQFVNKLQHKGDSYLNDSIESKKIIA